VQDIRDRPAITTAPSGQELHMFNRAIPPALALILGACSDDRPTGIKPSSQPAAIVVQAGDGQTEVVARTLANPLVARVMDARGRRVRDARVAFEVVSGGGAIVGRAYMLTDTAGLASAVWQLGTSTATDQAVRASVMTSLDAPNGINVTFRATGRPDVARFVEVEASGETIEPASELTRTVVARAYDYYRNPAPDATVQWSAPMAGTLRAGETATGPDGTTVNEWTLRATSGATLGAGAYWITATLVNASGATAWPVPYVVTVGDARLAATALAVGASHTCAVADAGQIYCWGDGSYSQLGADTRPPGPYAVPISAGAESFTQIVAGRAHTCALTTPGKTFCWGTNGEGQLGDGTQAFRSGAVAVDQRGTFVSLVAGGEHTCGLTDEGTAFCWGSNRFGQLGDGSLTASPTPNEVAGGARFTSLTAGVYHTCGLTTDGRTLCWGSDEFGQIGSETPDGSCPTRCVTIPTPVAGSFVALSAGMQFTCGVEQDGVTWCWGARLLARTKVESSVPFASLVGSRASDACGMTDEGRPSCWTFYYDDYYYYYDDPAGITTPQPVGGGHTFSSFRLGGSQVCGIENGDPPWVVCWRGLPSATTPRTEPDYVLRVGRP
jgi:hypothetical protein